MKKKKTNSISNKNFKVSVAQSLPSSQIIAVPPQQTQLIPTTIPTPEPIRNPTPILPSNAVVVPDSPKNQVFSQVNFI